LAGTCHSPGGESHGPGGRTASSRKIHVPHRSVDLSHRGRRQARRERSPSALRSRGRAPCGSDPGVHRWQQLVPCVPPPYSIEGREMTGKTLDYTAHMYSSKEKLQRGEGRPSSTHHIRYGSWCPTKSASLLASAGSGTQRRCSVQAVGFRGCVPGDTEAKIPFNLPIRPQGKPMPAGQKHHRCLPRIPRLRNRLRHSQNRWIRRCLRTTSLRPVARLSETSSNPPNRPHARFLGGFPWLSRVFWTMALHSWHAPTVPARGP